MMIDMVLATEMTKHFEHLSKFNGAITKLLKSDGEEDEPPTVSSIFFYI